MEAVLGKQCKYEYELVPCYCLNSNNEGRPIATFWKKEFKPFGTGIIQRKKFLVLESYASTNEPYRFAECVVVLNGKHTAIVPCEAVKIVSTEKSEYTNRLIISIYTDEDYKKKIRYIGYGEDGFKFTSYEWFTVPLENAVKEGIYSYAEKHKEESPCFTENCTETEMVMKYHSSDNGTIPMFIFEESISSRTADGVYVVIRKE